MKRLSRIVVSVLIAAPISAFAQTSPPAPGYESKKTTDSGQSTTYPKDGGQAKPGAVDKTQSAITKGDGKAPQSTAKPLDEPTTSDKPAKSGSQSGPTPK